MNREIPSEQNSTPKTYSFGRFVFDLERGRLMREGEEIKLRPKSYEVLRYLVEHLGRVVGKEELLKAVWPDSFVTDDSLVQCVRDIRRALEDDSQHFIKTVPKRGYVFETAGLKNESLREAPNHTASKAELELPLEKETAVSDKATVSHTAVKRVGYGRRIWIGGVVGLLAVATVFTLVRSYQSAKTPKLWRAVPLTTYPGIERNPSLSPDSNQVAFEWNGDKQDNFDIYIKSIDSGDPVRLTTNPADDVSPAWSPDGRTIAFLRWLGGERHELVLIPALGGHERKLTDIRRITGVARQNLRVLSWTPDAQWIAVSHKESAEPSEGLFLVSVLTGEKRRLTHPPTGSVGDYAPAFSPNGRAIAFSRLVGAGAGELFLLKLREDFESSGEARPLTADNRKVTGVAWHVGGDRILYTLGMPDGQLKVASTSASPMPEEVSVAEAPMADLDLGRHLVYSRATGRDTNIWRAEIPVAGAASQPPRLLISSTRSDILPQYSPDAKKIAFVSDRSGTREIWISNSDASNAVQLTFFGGPLVGPPNWSSDGGRLVFHVRLEGQSDLFTISTNGGQPMRLTSERSDDFLPTYSHDGHWIYFGSTRLGQPDIWKIPTGGGQAIQLTTGGAVMPIESPDGKTLFYSHLLPEKGIWKIPVEGGEAVQVTGPRAEKDAFAVGPTGIYYVAAPELPNQSIVQLVEFATGQTRTVVVTDREIGLQISVSNNERFLIFAQSDHPGADLMLIKNFSLP